MRYWRNLPNFSESEKLEGLIHSILCILDGVSGSFEGDIENIAKYKIMLHEKWGKYLNELDKR